MIVRAHILDGREREQKEAFIAEITQGICRVLSIPAEEVRVLLVEFDPGSWGIAGETAERIQERKGGS